MGRPMPSVWTPRVRGHPGAGALAKYDYRVIERDVWALATSKLRP